MITLLYTILAGGCGAGLRYFFDQKIPRPLDFPCGLWFVNCLGCFIFGFSATYMGTATPTATIILTGFCGGFTTWSTHSVQTIVHICNAEAKKALLRASGLIFLCLCSTTFGALCG